MNLVLLRLHNQFQGIPRVSGDEPKVMAIVADEFKYSPRERG